MCTQNKAPQCLSLCSGGAFGGSYLVVAGDPSLALLFRLSATMATGSCCPPFRFFYVLAFIALLVTALRRISLRENPEFRDITDI